MPRGRALGERKPGCLATGAAAVNGGRVSYGLTHVEDGAVEVHRIVTQPQFGPRVDRIGYADDVQQVQCLVVAGDDRHARTAAIDQLGRATQDMRLEALHIHLEQCDLLQDVVQAHAGYLDIAAFRGRAAVMNLRAVRLVHGSTSR